ncbi:Rid family detoxifying hydrolase [Acidaminobacter hydrogenoformans]|uniref:2-iminobutanoate/2-iminopropanoate deaminase n=1 Tax=Acidaminobacter hydrogenoformans DSM 2784 TaxID=1120920 RepID=A0A1G5RUR2_9FIRM|nr:Rid family detoxifying hydrolase [Acidaminobacter hydrogenoformans]SCZ77191.1 2-iminobutanoate/2-iminopropanoate deaminase [Acidaminobacter hydrogenoformans DSM 2784]
MNGVMKPKVIATEKAPGAVGPYSQGMNAGPFIYVSGQLPINSATGEHYTEIEQAAKQSLSNCLAIVEAGGGTLETIVKVEIFIRDMSLFSRMNAVYAEFFGDHKPARAAVEVSKLPLDAVIEIQMIAFTGTHS